VDVGHEPQRLGEAVDDLRAQRRAVDRARPPHVDGDLGSGSSPRPSRALPTNGRTITGARKFLRYCTQSSTTAMRE
jgi:hypothetical protein